MSKKSGLKAWQKKIEARKAPVRDEHGCKFCDNPLEQGCDTKMSVRFGTWCGQCQGGRDALFGQWSDGCLMRISQIVSQEYARDPIYWSAPALREADADEQTRARLQAHWNRLWLHDMASHMAQEMKARGLTGEDQQ